MRANHWPSDMGKNWHGDPTADGAYDHDDENVQLGCINHWRDDRDRAGRHHRVACDRGATEPLRSGEGTLSVQAASSVLNGISIPFIAVNISIAVRALSPTISSTLTIRSTSGPLPDCRVTAGPLWPRAPRQVAKCYLFQSKLNAPSASTPHRRQLPYASFAFRAFPRFANCF